MRSIFGSWSRRARYQYRRGRARPRPMSRAGAERAVSGDRDATSRVFAYATVLPLAAIAAEASARAARPRRATRAASTAPATPGRRCVEAKRVEPACAIPPGRVPRPATASRSDQGEAASRDPDTQRSACAPSSTCCFSRDAARGEAQSSVASRRLGKGPSRASPVASRGSHRAAARLCRRAQVRWKQRVPRSGLRAARPIISATNAASAREAAPPCASGITNLPAQLACRSTSRVDGLFGRSGAQRVASFSLPRNCRRVLGKSCSSESRICASPLLLAVRLRKYRAAGRPALAITFAWCSSVRPLCDA